MCIRDRPRTVVFFDSPHRLADTLVDAVDVLGPDREAAVCRELTKTYEEIRRGPLADLAQWAAEGVRGEITVVLAPGERRVPAVDDLVEQAEQLVAGGLRLKEACAQVTEGTGVSRRDIYEAVLAARTETD